MHQHPAFTCISHAAIVAKETTSTALRFNVNKFIIDKYNSLKKEKKHFFLKEFVIFMSNWNYLIIDLWFIKSHVDSICRRVVMGFKIGLLIRSVANYKVHDGFGRLNQKYKLVSIVTIDRRPLRYCNQDTSLIVHHPSSH